MFPPLELDTYFMENASLEEMQKKTKLICSIPDHSIVEEALSFLEQNRVTVRPEKDEFSESVAEFMRRNRLKIDLAPRAVPGLASLTTPCSEFLSAELRTPDPAVAHSAFTSGYQSVDRLSDIDEFEENLKCMSVEDRTRHYYTLFLESDSTGHSPPPSPAREELRSEPQPAVVNNKHISPPVESPVTAAAETPTTPSSQLSFLPFLPSVEDGAAGGWGC